MANQPFSKMYDVEIVGGDQRQRLAEMLRANALNAPQGQMVSGWYVPPSWSQNLAQLANTAVGVFGGQALEEERNKEMAELLRKRKEGIAVESPQQTVINNIDSREVQGQTPFANPPAQTELQKIAGIRPQSTEQSNFPAVAPQQQQPKYRPMTQDELDENTMQMYRVDPRMAGLMTSIEANRLSKEEAKQIRAEKLASEEKLLRMQLEGKKELAQFMAGNRQPGAPIAVMGPNGQPVYVSPSQAYGMTPASGANQLTESQGKAAVFQSQMIGASNNLNKLQEEKKYDPTSKVSQAETALAGGWTNLAASESAQQAKQAQDQWTEAYLRFKTGAGTNAGEIEVNRRTFFPVVGDSAKTIEQKANARKQAEKDIGLAAGRGSGMGVQSTSASKNAGTSSNW